MANSKIQTEVSPIPSYSEDHLCKMFLTGDYIETTTIDKINNPLLKYKKINSDYYVNVETGEVFNRLRDCEEVIGANGSHINECLRGRQETHRGYHFEYI